MDKVLALQVTGELGVQIPKPTQSQAGVAAPCRGRGTEMVSWNKMELEISGFSEIIFLN